jgi:gliding motility-associated-like protein
VRTPLTKTALLFAVVVFTGCFITAKAQQSVWHYQTRSITVTEDGKSRISIFKDSSKPSLQQRTTNTCPTNIDFEAGNFSNWQLFTGTASAAGGVNNVINLNTVTNPIANRHTIISSTSVPALDPYGAFPVRCPNGSGYSVKLGSTASGSQAERIRYTFTVPASANDYNLLYHYAVVFQNPQVDHTPAEQPRFQAKIYDAATGSGIACATYDFTATAGLPGFNNSSCTNCNPANTTSNPVLFKNWTPVTINLSGYAGKTMILEFTTEDCTKGGHFGYAYVDVNTGCSGLVSGAAYCQGVNSVTLTAPSGYQSYRWWNDNYTQQLGTGATLTLNPPPAANSTIRIDLIPFPGFGCRDTVYTTVTVNPKPVAGFDVASPVCLGASPAFVNTSNIPSGSLTYKWSFGDNNSSTATTPTHLYAATGQYNVKLVATSDIGCKDSITKPLNIVANPVPSFDITSANRQCVTGNNFTFQNTSPTSAGIDYTWHFGDGATSIQTPNTNHSYATTNTYNVKLLAVQSSNTACKDSITKQVIVDPSPTVAFGFYNSGRQCFRDHSFRFKNNSVSAVPLTYEWHFGDGGTSSLAEPVYTYATPGTYQVKLIAYASGLCKDSITIPVTVDPTPDADFQLTSNTTQCQDKNLFTFANNSSVSDGSTLSYLWNFNDGNTSTLKEPQHIYTTYGTFAVQLITTTVNGCADTTSKNIIVNPKPIAAFNVAGGLEQCFRSNDFNFLNSTTIPSGTFSQTWAFHDGTTASSFNTSHNFAAVGTYRVSLITTSNKGCIDSTSKDITINPDPVAAFTINDTTQCLKGNEFIFTNASSLFSGTLSYDWRFGDGNNSVQQDPSTTYSTFAPNYNVRLIAASNKGCKDTLIKKIYLFRSPTAGFNINSLIEQCEKGNSFQFSNTSVFGTPLTYNWNFGDGSSSTQTNTIKHYNTQGDYSVTLIASTTENSCADTLSKSIRVHKNPGAAFTVNATPQCLTGNSFSFSGAPTGTNYQYNWSFGDGITSNSAAPTHSYTTANSFPVRLIVDHLATATLTCSDTSSQTMVINPMPAGFITNKGTYDLCQGASKALNASGGTSYQWFLNGIAITGANAATHNAVVEGIYTVDAINQFGCRAASSDIATINEIKKPSANFTWDSYCINKSVQFTNTTVPGAHNIVNYAWDLGNGSNSTNPNPQQTYNSSGAYNVKLSVTSTLCPAHLSVMEKTINIEHPLPGTRYSSINGVIGNTYILSARTVGVKYQWLPSTDLTNPTSRTPILKATGEQDYRVVMTTSSGCQTVDSIKILIFSQSQVLVPKAFTPNNDGLNDVLYPILVGIKQLKYFRVYNRWGNLVFNSADPKSGWNGFYKGTLQGSETYTWIAEAIDEKGNTIRNGGNTILIR